MKTFVFSRTMKAAEHPKVNLVAGDAGEFVRELRGGRGKDIWLFGGGELFRSLLDASPGGRHRGGRRSGPAGRRRAAVAAAGAAGEAEAGNSRAYAKTGTVSLECSVEYAPEKSKPARRARAAGKARK
jgi:hypothetical protein